MAAGITKQLATLCWKPIATKIMTGNQIVSTLPAASFAPYDNHNAKPTNQLQPIPEPHACHQETAIL